MPSRFALVLVVVLCGTVPPVAGQQPARPATMSPVVAASPALVVRPDERPAEAHIACGSIRFLVDSEDTAGAFAMVESNQCGRPVTGSIAITGWTRRST